MALLFTQKPINTSSTAPVVINYTPIVPYVITRNSSIASLFYYKLVLTIYQGSGTSAGSEIAKLKQRRNTYSGDDAPINFARAFFDLKDIIRTILQSNVKDQNITELPFKPVWMLGANDTAKIFSTNRGQIKTVTVQATEYYSTSATATPVEVTTDAIDDEGIYMFASKDLHFARDSAVLYLQPDGNKAATYDYEMDTTSARFLSDLPKAAPETDFSFFNYGTDTGDKYINYVNVMDFYCLGFMNGKDQLNSNARGFVVEYYQEESVGNFYFFRNESANGGADPVTGSTMSDSQLILYLGCGPKNLEEQAIQTSARPSNQSSGEWTHYRIFAVSDIVTYPGIGSYTPVSANYWFIRDCAVIQNANLELSFLYKPIRLSWLNSLGCWDTYTFLGKSIETVEIQRNSYNKLIGNYNDQRYNYGNYESDKTISNVKSKVKMTINTKYIFEEYVPLIESLIKSNEVYVHDAGIMPGATFSEFFDNRQAVIITDTSFIRKTGINDGVIQYTINLEYANPLNNSSQ